MNEIFTLSLLVFVTVLAYWHRESWLYMVSAFGLISYGFAYWDTSWYIGLMVVAAGAVGILKAFLERSK